MPPPSSSSPPRVMHPADSSASREPRTSEDRFGGAMQTHESRQTLSTLVGRLEKGIVQGKSKASALLEITACRDVGKA
eukprot:1151432-Pelagomonas_calceolata.AAC.1